jgi:hypothetical protein
MKRVVEVDTGVAFEESLGEQITVFCCNYIYTGKLVGVNTTHIELESPKIVYETGELTSNTWRDAQKLPHNWFIMKSAVESWGVLDKQ